MIPIQLVQAIKWDDATKKQPDFFYLFLSISPGQVPQMPQGVDLNLDKFNLSRIEKFAGYLPAAAGTSDSLETKVTLGKAFLQALAERKLGTVEVGWG